MALGENIKALRERNGWSTYELGERAGTNQSSISRIELGKTRPRPEKLKKIADALGVEVAQLEYGLGDLELVPVGTRRVPILDYVQAGSWAGVAPAFRDAEMQANMLVDSQYSVDAFGLQIRGLSMFPEYQEGDVVIIDPAVSPHPNDCVVATNEAGEATFKMYKDRGFNHEGKAYFELVALNDGYPTWRSDMQQISIVGTEVEHRKFRRRR